MLALNHTLIGAAIGSQIENIPAVIGLGVASHFVLDFLPHIDPGIEISGKELKPKIKYIIVFFDIFLSFVVLLLALTVNTTLNKTTVITGAVTALFVDIIFNVPFWMSYFRNTSPFSKIHRFHELIHKPLEKYKYSFGIPLQLMMIVVSIWLLLK